MSEIKDLRAPALPNEQFSAYCKTCWNPVYAFWIEKEHHGSGCMFGHDRAHACPDAMGRAKFTADMNRMREASKQSTPAATCKQSAK